MIFFWDRNIPKAIPEALRVLRAPFENEIHAEHFLSLNNYRRTVMTAGCRYWETTTGSFSRETISFTGSPLRLQQLVSTG